MKRLHKTTIGMLTLAFMVQTSICAQSTKTNEELGFKRDDIEILCDFAKTGGEKIEFWSGLVPIFELIYILEEIDYGNLSSAIEKEEAHKQFVKLWNEKYSKLYCERNGDGPQGYLDALMFYSEQSIAIQDLFDPKGPYAKNASRPNGIDINRIMYIDNIGGTKGTLVDWVEKTLNENINVQKKLIYKSRLKKKLEVLRSYGAKRMSELK